MSHGCRRQTLNDKINMQTETNDGNGKEQQTLAPTGLLGATVTVTVNKTHRIELGSNPAHHRVAFVMSHLPECFRGYWLMRELPDGTDEKTDYLTTVKDGDKFWAIPPCGF